MTDQSWLILIRHGKGVNKKEEIIRNICEYVFQYKFEILFHGLKNESWSFGKAARKGHSEIYDYIRKVLSDEDQPLITLIDGPQSELLDNRDRIKLCEKASLGDPKFSNTFLKLRNEINQFLERIITGGEKLVKFRPKLKESSQKTILVLVCVWWDMSGIIFYELLEPGQTVNAAVYCNQLERVKQKLIRTGRVLVNNQCRILQHNNASAYTAKKTREKIKELGFERLPHPSNSKNLLPSHYHLFKSLEETLTEGLTSVEEVKTHVEKFLNDKPKNFFEEGIKQLPSRWEQNV